MRLHGFLPALFLFITGFFTSCEYKPKGDYYLDLTPVKPGSISITIPGHTDTLVATYPQAYEVSVECQTRKVIFNRLFINGEEKYLHTCGNKFPVTPFQFISKDSIYTLTVEVGINTGSGSIGDALGTEGYLFQKDFILVVLQEKISFDPDILFDRSGGRMKVFLDVPPNVKNIRKVTFSKRVWMSQYSVFATVPGTSHFEAYDPGYVGESAVYSLQTYIGDPSGTVFIPFVQGGEMASGDLPVVSVDAAASGFPLLRWEKTHYAANCGGYRIYGIQGSSSTIQLMGSVSNISDTVFEAAGTIFPSYYRFRLAAIPTQIPPGFTEQVAWESYAREVTTYVGMNSFSFYRFLSPDSPFIYYTSGSDEIYEYSVETGSVTDVITTADGWFYTYSVSPNGKYLLAANGFSNFSYLFYDLTANQATWVPSSQVIGAGEETGIISVADNGIASIISGNRLVVYDFLNQAPVVQQQLPASGERTVISADGRYVFAQAGSLYLYKLTGNTLEQKWTSSSQPGTVSYYTFEPARPSKARILIGQTFFTKDCETWATEGSFNPDFDNLCNIDFANGHILGKTSAHLRVLDLNTGALQFENPILPDLSVTNLRIKKNTVYSSGKKLNIFR